MQGRGRGAGNKKTVGKADEYRFRKGCLGRGAYGAAFLVERSSDGKEVVCKEINIGSMPEQERDDALAEAKVLKSMNHRNIIAFFDMFVDGPFLNIVTEYCDGGTLQDRIQKRFSPFPESEVLKCIVSMTEALQYIHNERILHRDLKCENIFLTKANEVKLGDFGLARVLSSQSKFAETICGTPFNLSPEICQGMPYNEKSDMWALGCIMYELLTRKRPFDGTVIGQVVSKIMSGGFPRLDEKCGYSKDTIKLSERLLSHNPADRPSTSDILSMPFLRQYVSDRKTAAPSHGPAQPPSRLRIGYIFYDKGDRKIMKGGTSFHGSLWPQFIELASSQGIDIIKIDPNKDYAEQGPFNLVLHRLTKDLAVMNENREAARKVKAIEKYADEHPDVLVIDPPRNVQAVLDRAYTSLVFQNTFKQKTDDWEFLSPRFVAIEDAADMSKAEKFKFPCVLKPRQSSGTDASHELALLFGPQDLKEFKPPYILQRFVNHGGIVYKVYVIGAFVAVKTRRSIPDLAPTATRTLRFNSQRTGKALDGHETSFVMSFDQELEDPPDDMVNIMADIIRENLGLTVFGFDIIRETETGKFYIIDINYFPGYRGVAFAPRFLDFCYAQMGLLSSISSFSSVQGTEAPAKR